MGLPTALRINDRSSTEQLIPRLVAIRAIIDLAGDEEARDLAAEGLRVLGVKHDEIIAAMLN
ncbi:MAG: hypothetical protein ACLQPH_12975 [Acidimicrobiales bacterium]